jgi:carotenoid cleavage dioxygenase-like enzyme
MNSKIVVLLSFCGGKINITTTIAMLAVKAATTMIAGPYQMISKVQFVPKNDNKIDENADSNDGFLLSIVHKASPERQECALLVWDAATFNLGPMARISLGKLMSWCVHGTWIPDYVAIEKEKRNE